MPAIPDANLTRKLHIELGSLKMWKAKVEGDGSGTTIAIPVGRVEGYWTQNIDDTSDIPAITESNKTITYAAPPTSGKFHWLFVIGF